MIAGSVSVRSCSCLLISHTKIARPFHGQFHVLKVMDNNAQVAPVDKTQEEPIIGYLRGNSGLRPGRREPRELLSLQKGACLKTTRETVRMLVWGPELIVLDPAVRGHPGTRVGACNTCDSYPDYVVMCPGC